MARLFERREDRVFGEAPIKAPIIFLLDICEEKLGDHFGLRMRRDPLRVDFVEEFLRGFPRRKRRIHELHQSLDAFDIRSLRSNIFNHEGLNTWRKPTGELHGITSTHGMTNQMNFFPAQFVQYQLQIEGKVLRMVTLGRMKTSSVTTLVKNESVKVSLKRGRDPAPIGRRTHKAVKKHELLP